MAPSLKALEAQVQAADRAVWRQVIFTPEREKAEKHHAKLLKKLNNYKAAHTADKAVIYARGLARAAKDAGVKFALKPDFHKAAGPFDTPNAVKKALKVSKTEDAVDAGKKFAKKHDIPALANHAVVTESLKDMLAGTTAGFIAAQVAAVIVDVVGTVVSLGAYAAAAPAVHAALAAGQGVSTAAIKQDMASNEQKYQKSLAAYQKRHAKAGRSKPKAKTEAAEEEAGEPEAKPAGPSKWVWIVGGAAAVGLVGAAVAARQKGASGAHR